MKNMTRLAFKWAPISYLVLLLTACEGDEGPSSVMPKPMNGANGESVTISGLTNGATVPCTRAGGDVWTFQANFAAENLRRPCKAQLLVEITNDTSGNDVWESGRGPYVQGASQRVGAGQTMGSLAGILGPPVSTNVRFNLAVRLVDASGNVVAVSETVSGLKPVVN